MKILVTGAAGFIGSHVSRKLSLLGYEVLGLDNLNDYYDVRLKYDRLKNLCGINPEDLSGINFTTSSFFPNYRFAVLDIQDRERVSKLFREQRFDTVCHLAAQAGIRYSIENPYAYIDSNINGFITVLEGSRLNNVSKLVYASSSSVYGNSSQVPFDEDQPVDRPVSLYAATKRSNELMAFSYNHLYGLKTIGLRLFTVYGPWGRPDMAPFLFTKAIMMGRPVKLFNSGNMYRDFTYIDDTSESIVRILINDPPYNSRPDSNGLILNIGNESPVSVNDFIGILESSCGKKALIENMPGQPGDVQMTFASVARLRELYNYAPETSLHSGLERYINWFREYYTLNASPGMN